jgi:hypothetical protein
MSRYAGKERVALAWQAAREVLHTADYERDGYEMRTAGDVRMVTNSASGGR